VAGTPAYSPRDLLEDPTDWTGTSNPTWVKASSLEEAAKVVLAAEQHRAARLIRPRLTRGGNSIAELAYATGVGERQLKAKLAGRTRMQLEELLTWKWRLDDHRSVACPTSPSSSRRERPRAVRPDSRSHPELRVGAKPGCGRGVYQVVIFHLVLAARSCAQSRR
jgi:hypothetical protein